MGTSSGCNGLRAFEFHRRLIVARLKPFADASVALNERIERAQ
jgi:hypothetical protein